MNRLSALVLAGTLTLPAVAAATRISVVSFSGPGANAARNDVVSALCDVAECVPQSKVAKGSKPDWKKVKKERVTYVVTGKVVKKGKKATVELAVLKGPGKPKFKKGYPADARGRMTDRAVDQAKAQLLAAMGIAEKDEAPGPDEKPVATREPPREEKPSSKPEKDPFLELAERERPNERGVSGSSGGMGSDPASGSAVGGESSEVVDTPPAPRGTSRQPLVAVEVGPDLLSRRLAYSGVETANLRSYQASFIVSPRVHAEVFPLARSGNAGAGLGIEAAYAMAVGLKSKRVDGPTHPTALSQLDLGAKYRLLPLASIDLAIVPQVGFRNTSFSVGQADDGTTLDGMPGVSYSALVVGVGAEVPFAEGKVVTFARAAYLPVLSSGEIISDTYFKRGSTSGFEATLGLGFQIVESLQARLTGNLTRYGLAFQTEAGDTYVAQSAVDQYLGVNLAVRYSY